MLPKYLSRPLNRQGLNRVSVPGCSCSAEHRVVNRLLGRFDCGLEQWRHGVIRQHFDMPRQRFILCSYAHLRRRRECDGVIAAAVRG